MTLEYSRARVEAVLREIGRLKESDFPHSDSRFALERIEQHFLAIRGDLAALSTSSNAVTLQTACSESLKQIFDYHQLLGFILRSTNVRNSFEIYRPILRLSQQLLGPDTRLVLSSEWEYSPHVYRAFAAIPEIVLLGLPASESGNPLLTPLAGHELGHTAWQSRNLLSRFSKDIEAAILETANADQAGYAAVFGSPLVKLFAGRNLSQAYAWAARQAEESFCDFMGIRIFGESYFHAYAYLLSPGLTTQRPLLYPSNSTRAANAVRAAKRFSAVVPPGFESAFSDAPPSNDDKVKFLLKLADASLEAVVEKLIDEVDSLATAASIPIVSQERVADAFEAFTLMVPATGASSLANILNAGWKASLDSSLWTGLPNVYASKRAVLNEIVLKSVEVLEIEQIMGTTP